MNREKELGSKEVPTIFCEFYRLSKSALLGVSDFAKEFAESWCGTSFKFGIEEKEREDLWCARDEAWEKIHRAHRGKETLIVDATIPISLYSEMALFS